MTAFDKIVDLLMFRSQSDDNLSEIPTVTQGSIIWGMILRASIIVVLSMLIIGYYKLYNYWWLSFFLLWLLAVYPAYRQYQQFSNRVKKVAESTLCGSCKYFETSGQLCSMYDEHVSTNYIPCEGENWEPKSFED